MTVAPVRHPKASWLRSASVACLSAVLLSACGSSSGHPSRVHVLGRDYGRGDGTPLTLASARVLEPQAFVVVANGRLVRGHLGPNQPTVIFVRDHARYYEYALIGGP
jgi:hypothetical protein